MYENETKTMNAAESSDGVSARQGCFSKIKEACSCACDRFFKARLAFSYRMTVRMRGAASASDMAAASPETQENCVAEAQTKCGNVMTKEGDCEIRLSDMALGLAGAVLMCSALGCVKKMLCCKCRR